MNNNDAESLEELYPIIHHCVYIFTAFFYQFLIVLAVIAIIVGELKSETSKNH